MGRSLISTSSDKTFAFGFELGQKSAKGTLFALRGELGAGKTTFVKGIVAGATGNLEVCVASPTFVMLNSYEPKTPKNKRVHHFDLYRLGSLDAFLAQGFEEYLLSDGICCIEWSERIAPILPQQTQTITLLHDGENRRMIQWDY